MSLTIEPTRFVGMPLVIQATAENDYNVLCDGLRAGRIMLRSVANGATHWFWTVTGPALVQANINSSGEADTLNAAKKAFRERFDAWLSWAVKADVAVYWHQAGHREELS